MTEPKTPELNFVALASCASPMEVELLPAALREAEIPHRTEWSGQGELTLFVPQDWEEEARETLDRAGRIFFGEQTGAGPRSVTSEAEPAPAAGAEENLDEEDEDGMLFGGEAMPTPEEMREKPVWPAWALACVPGLGLGHLYAGSFQVFFYLFFCSLLGVLFFQFTHSVWSFLLNLFAWGIDLGFAPLLLKSTNRRARRMKRRAEEAERRFLGSI